MSTDFETNRPARELPDAVWQRMESLLPPRRARRGTRTR